jgi:hypothetical protein
MGSVTIGSPIAVGTTTGQDKDGNQLIFVIAGQTTIPQAFGGGYGASGPLQPGTLVAIGLSEGAGQQVTVTSTQSTTVTSSTTVISTEEVSTGLPAEVTYAVVAVAVIAIIAAAVLAMRKRA